MRLLQSTHGISKLVFVISLLVALIIGATLSYVWTMGYYASPEFQLPKSANITIEDVVFPPQNTTFFNVTVLCPSYSQAGVEVSQIFVLTNDSNLHETEAPALPYSLEVGNSQTFKAYWNWANHTGQAVKVIVHVTEGSGANIQYQLPS